MGRGNGSSDVIGCQASTQNDGKGSKRGDDSSGVGPIDDMTRPSVSAGCPGIEQEGICGPCLEGSHGRVRAKRQGLDDRKSVKAGTDEGFRWLIPMELQHINQTAGGDALHLLHGGIDENGGPDERCRKVAQP